MLSDKPLPAMTHPEAVDVLAYLYKNYVNRNVNEGRKRTEIERMNAPDDIAALICDIGKAMQLAESRSNRNLEEVTKKSLLAKAGSNTLEQLYFKVARGLDLVFEQTNLARLNAEDFIVKARQEKAVLETDLKACRRACNIPAYKELARPTLEVLFGKTGADIPYIDPANIPMDDQNQGNQPKPLGME